MEYLGIHVVHGWPLVDVVEEACGLDHVSDAAARGSQDTLQVLEHLFGLPSNVLGLNLAIGSVNGELARYKDHAVAYDGLGVGA